jgi:preprotein translocase subunit SecE
VADSKRRGDDDADDRFDDSVDDEAVTDEFDDEDLLDDDSDDEDGDQEPRRRVGAGTVTKARSARSGKTSAPGKARSKTGDAPRSGNRLVNFFREVVAELRKVIYPTRKELITYTTVVVVFVTIMLTIVASFDFAFAKAVLFVFGNGKAAGK